MVFFATVFPAFARVFDDAFADMRRQALDPAYQPAPFDIAGFFRWFLGVTVIMALIFIALSAAAITRRLHDTGRRGWWGLLPVPFLFTGFTAFSGVMGTMRGGVMDDEKAQGFFLMFGNNIVYLAALGLLCFLLSRPGVDRENRFGPQPTPLA